MNGINLNLIFLIYSSYPFKPPSSRFSSFLIVVTTSFSMLRSRDISLQRIDPMNIPTLKSLIKKANSDTNHYKTQSVPEMY